MSTASVLGGKRLWDGEMEDSEWETIVENLRRAERWDEMWKLIFLAPVEQGADMVRAMRSGRWKPNETDRDLWKPTGREIRGLCGRK